MVRKGKKESEAKKESSLYYFTIFLSVVVVDKVEKQFEIKLNQYLFIHRGEGNGSKGVLGPKGPKGEKGEGPFVPKGPKGMDIRLAVYRNTGYKLDQFFDID